MKLTTLLIFAALPFADAYYNERSRFQRERERLMRASRMAAEQNNIRRGHVNEYPIRGINERQLGPPGGPPRGGSSASEPPPTSVPPPTPSTPVSSPPVTSQPPSTSSPPPTSSQPPPTSSQPPPTSAPPPTSNDLPPSSSASPSSSSELSTSTSISLTTVTDGTSSTGGPTATTPPNPGSSGPGKGTIIGLSVTGGIAVVAVAGFLIWKLRSKRFSDFDDDNGDAIKWPELNQDAAAMHPLPTRATGRAGVETNALDQGEFDNQSITGASNVDLHNSQNVNYGNQYSSTAAYYDDPHGAAAGQGGYYDPYNGPVPQSMAEDQYHTGGPPSVYGAAGGIVRTGTPGQESVYGARSRSPGPAAAYGRSPSPGPNVAYGARAASPGPGAVYGGAPGRTASPGPNLAYGGAPGRVASPGPNLAYSTGPGRTPSPGPNQAYGTYQQ